ncbi:MAG: hypothetical protein IT556_13685 [Acetobacteraceae bacterium]|nr:hypothetical protein [Acetobacteraceae bacterium]
MAFDQHRAITCNRGQQFRLAVFEPAYQVGGTTIDEPGGKPLVQCV